MTATVNLDHIAIVLAEPQIPENIGSVARAMNNTGIRHLVLVNPKNCELSRILKSATGTSVDIVEEMEVYDGLESALGPFQHIVGTTARLGVRRPAMTEPRPLAQDLISVSQNNRVAILFGPEDHGLSNDQLQYCHTITTIAHPCQSHYLLDKVLWALGDDAMSSLSVPKSVTRKAAAKLMSTGRTPLPMV